MKRKGHLFEPVTVLAYYLAYYLIVYSFVSIRIYELLDSWADFWSFTSFRSGCYLPTWLCCFSFIFQLNFESNLSFIVAKLYKERKWLKYFFPPNKIIGILYVLKCVPAHVFIFPHISSPSVSLVLTCGPSSSAYLHQDCRPLWRLQDLV